MPSDCIIVMRHAQKPEQKPTEQTGVREDGAPDAKSLSVQGWQRAGALAALFSGRKDHLEALGLKRPDVIFASGHDARKIEEGSAEVKIGSHSRRPVETVTPMARRLGLTPVTDHLRSEEAKLVADVKKRDGVGLICWQHEQIPAIGELILGRPGIVPTQWAEDCYSDIWIFTRDKQEWSFRALSLPLIESD